LFGGEALQSGVDLGVIERGASPAVFEAKLALVVVCLARGFLNFIWSIRQLNYTLALMGAIPDGAPAERLDRFAEAA
ncbi:DUF599 family protein, partial [Salmonella enterica]|uniref:DUF599 family protein n=1 Tax=Salmonella enterica TaxID=28901 RepID=UPI003CFB3723